MAAEEVYIGVPVILPADELYHLRPIFFPLGKVGGKPSWLEPVKVPKADEVKCEYCGQSMIFVVQLYATNPKDPPSAFHRYLYVFVCRNGSCSKANQNGNMKVLRSQLPRDNPFYGKDKSMDPLLDGDVADPFRTDAYANLCNTCGLKATNKCGKCSSVWYCSRDHQMVDWKSGHKESCGKSNVESSSQDKDESELFKLKAKAANPLLFNEHGLKMHVDYCSKAETSPLDEEDDDDDDEGGDNADISEEHKELMAKLSQNAPTGGDVELDNVDEEKDPQYHRFVRIAERIPEQILRYTRNGQPLSASDHCTLPTNIPKCPLCGSERTFELQLMPHLLSIMDVDVLGASIDWATVIIYTCPKSCDIGEKGYVEEYLWKQDFVSNSKSEPVNEEDEAE